MRSTDENYLHFLHNRIAIFLQVCYNTYDMFSFVYGNIDFAHKIDNPSSPTEEYYKHMHAFIEILYFVRGDVDYTVESETRTLRPGDVVLISPGKYHFATVNLREKSYERYVLKFPEIMVPGYIKETLLAHRPFFTDTAAYATIFTGLDEYEKNFSKEETHTLFSGELSKLLIMMNRTASLGKQKANPFIEKIITHINNNITEEITLETLADDLMYSKSYISNEFRKYMHIPVMQYVRSKKILFAHSLIMNGMKKCEAAEKLGFMNYSTFFRAYRKTLSANEFPDE